MKKLKNKLSLSKKTISELENEEMKNFNGGRITFSWSTGEYCRCKKSYMNYCATTSNIFDQPEL